MKQLNQPSKRKPVPEEITLRYVIDKTKFMDDRIFVDPEFDQDDWLNPKG